MSPRETSISSSRVRVTAWPGPACSSSPSKVTMDLTRLPLPDGRATTSSPLRTMPLAKVPAKPRKLRFGRFTYCTGKRMSETLRSPAISTVSRISISDWPEYQGERSLLLTTLSPFNADIGTKWIEVGFSLMRSANCR
ncbi:hypothetical protein D9M71_570140 [compost metagenome]